MKKLVLVSVAALFAVVLALNVSLSANHKTGQTSLLQISSANQAEAECVSDDFNDGRCSMANNCYAQSSPITCNWSKSF